MLRDAANIHPTWVGLLGGLAVGGTAPTAMPLLHEHDVTIMVLLSNLGGAALIVALGAALGGRKIDRAADR
jgi:hypothetical protein